MEEFLEGMHRGIHTNLEHLAIQQTYFLPSNGESEIQEKYDVEEILES